MTHTTLVLASYDNPLRNVHNLVVEVADVHVVHHILDAAPRAHNLPVRVHKLNALRTLPDRDRRVVQAGLRREVRDDAAAADDADRDAVRVRGEEDRNVDQILGVLPAARLAEPVVARAVLEQGPVPERAGERAERVDLAEARRAALVGGDEGREDVLPGGVDVAVGVRADGGRAGDGLGPVVADVVRLAGVVPGDDLDKVGLEGEGLGDAQREVELAAAVPVLAAVDVLELDGGEGCMSPVSIVTMRCTWSGTYASCRLCLRRGQPGDRPGPWTS